MTKFTNPFKGVKDGDIYPTSFSKGEDVPPELLAAAVEQGCAKGKSTTKKTTAAPPAKSNQSTPPQPETTLKGSSVLPDEIDIGDGKMIALDEAVKTSFAESKLTADAWNALPDKDREVHIANTLKAMQAKA